MKAALAPGERGIGGWVRPKSGVLRPEEWIRDRRTNAAIWSGADRQCQRLVDARHGYGKALVTGRWNGGRRAGWACAAGRGRPNLLGFAEVP